MAPRGRPPKPLEQKRLTGNPGKRNLPDVHSTGTLQPITEIPDPPADLGSTGSAYWMDVWQAGRTWLLSSEAFLVASVCRLEDQCEAFRADIDHYGTTIEGPVVYQGGLVEGVTKLYANPALASLRAAEKQQKSELSDLGIGPTARSRLGLGEVKRQSKLVELLERQHRSAGVAPALSDPRPS